MKTWQMSRRWTIRYFLAAVLAASSAFGATTSTTYIGPAAPADWATPANWDNGVPVTSHPGGVSWSVVFNSAVDFTASANVPTALTGITGGGGLVTFPLGMSMVAGVGYNPSSSLVVGTGGIAFGGQINEAHGTASISIGGDLTATSLHWEGSGQITQSGGLIAIADFEMPFNITAFDIDAWSFAAGEPSVRIWAGVASAGIYTFKGTPTFGAGFRPDWRLTASDTSGTKGIFNLNGWTMTADIIDVLGGEISSNKYATLQNDLGAGAGSGAVIDANTLNVGGFWLVNFNEAILDFVDPVTVTLRGSGTIYNNYSVNNDGSAKPAPFKADTSTLILDPAGGGASIDTGSQDRNSTGFDPADWVNNFAWDLVKIGDGDTITLTGDANVGAGNNALYARTMECVGSSGTIDLNGHNVYLLEAPSCVTFDNSGGGQVYYPGAPKPKAKTVTTPKTATKPKSKTADTGKAFSWRTAPPTREALGGTVLENDLVYVPGNGPRDPDYYPLLPVVQWGPIPAERPGRYRVRLRARTENFGASPLVLQAWVPKENGGAFDATGYGDIPIAVAATSMSGYRFNAPGEWQDFALDFDVESGNPVMVGAMYLGGTACAAGKVQIEKASLSLEKLELPLCVSWARPGKVRYKHGEPGTLEVRVVNATAASQEVQVRPVIVDEDGKPTSGTPVKFTVEPMATINGTVPFAVPAQDGGYEARAELLLAGKVIDQRGDVFAVSDSPFRCMIQSAVRAPYLLSGAHHLGLQGFKEKVLGNWAQYTKDCGAAVERARREYATYFEFFAWAREDATVMTEDSDEPYLCGQTFYPVSRKQILLLNRLMKEQGIVPAAYLNSVPFGWPGFEVVRRHPEWYAKANFNTAVMEKYLNGETVSGNVYPTINMNFEARSANGGQTYLEYHAAQLMASARQYGWEAYRYDAGTLAANHFPRMKAALAKLSPPVAIGNNLGIHCLGNNPSADWTTYCRDGSLMMEEDIRSAFDSPTDTHRRWVDYIDYLRRSSHMARSHGGHYTYINNNGNWLSTSLGFALGGHPWGSFDSPYGATKRFMIRYGSHFWDLRTQLLEAPEKVLAVTSRRPVWWKPLASERRLGAGRRQVIVPLFNPPAGEAVVNTTQEAPAEGVKVTFRPRPNEQVTAWLLSPEPVAHRVQLKTRPLPSGMAVTVPRFWGWVNVVFDCERK